MRLSFIKQTDMKPQLTASNKLPRNALLALGTQIMQISAAIVLMPVLLHRLGPERVGILSLIWIVVGYLSFLDLGIGVAVTRAIARASAQRDQTAISKIFSTAILSQLLIGIVATFVFYADGESVLSKLFPTRVLLGTEAISSIYVAFLALPAALVSSSSIGFLQGIERFDCIFWLQSPLSLVQYGLPLLCWLWRPHLSFAVGGLVLARWILMLVSLTVCFRVSPAARVWGGWDMRRLISLLRFGGWITLSGIVSPAMVYLDRFILAHFSSMASVAYYALAVDIGMKVLVIPSSLVSALFPRLSRTTNEIDGPSSRITAQSLKYVLFTVGVPASLIWYFATEILTAWMGAEFARQAVGVLQIIMVGVVANSLARVVQALLQAEGRPGVVAVTQTAEAVPALALSCGLVATWGLRGGAIAWSARLVLESGVLLALAGSAVRRDIRAQKVPAAAGILALYGLSLAIVGLAQASLAIRVGWALAATGVACVIAWRTTLTKWERAALLAFVRSPA